MYMDTCVLYNNFTLGTLLKSGELWKRLDHVLIEVFESWSGFLSVREKVPYMSLYNNDF